MTSIVRERPGRAWLAVAPTAVLVAHVGVLAVLGFAVVEQGIPDEIDYVADTVSAEARIFSLLVVWERSRR